MTRKKALLQRLKEWKDDWAPKKTDKPKLTPEQIELIRRTANIPTGLAIRLTVKENPTKSLNVKMNPEDFARLEQVAAIVADGNQSATVRKAIGVIYDDMVERGLIKAS